MSLTQTEIYNLALSACGSVATISSPAERSREAALCNLWFNVVRDNVLAAAAWPSVRKYARLERSAEAGNIWNTTSPDPEYAYAYHAPQDCIHPYHLQSFQPFSYGLIGTSRKISCNEPAPILFYNSRQINPDYWETGLQMAIVYALAFHISKPLTGRNSTQEINANLSQSFIDSAATSAANQQDTSRDTLPDWLQARGFGDARPERWYYPMQSLNLRTQA